MTVVTALVTFGVGCTQGVQKVAEGADAGVRAPVPGEGATGRGGKPEAEGEGTPTGLPTIKSVAPKSALVGSIGPTLVLKGTGFTRASRVEIEGEGVDTSFVSAKEVRVTLPDDRLAASGVLRLTVFTPPPGGGRSEVVDFAVENPTPALTVLEPTAALAGAGDVKLTVTGSAFVEGAQILFGNQTLATAKVADDRLEATVPGAALAASGSTLVKVQNPTPGGGASNPIAFTVANPSVTVSSVTPPTAVLGSAAMTVTVRGSGFVQASKASLNGVELVTRFTSGGELAADVTALSLANAAEVPLTVANPAPGGGVSMPFTFKVQNPSPTLASLTPATVAAGAAPTEVTLTGSAFVSRSEVRFGSAPAQTTFVNANTLKATLTAAQLASGGEIAVTVVNPTPGGGTSSPQAFAVAYPTPTVTRLAPGYLVAGSAASTLSVFGTGFGMGTTVEVGSSALATTFVSPTQVRTTVPAGLLASQGTLAVRVRNPAPGGGRSTASDLTVAPEGTATCDATGVDVALLGSAVTQDLTYTIQPSPRFAYNPQVTDFYTCAVSTLSTTTQYGAFVVVQNASPETKYLRAEASCASTDAAFMAVYPGRTTAPTTDAEKRACTGYVASGSAGGGGFTSSLSSGSQSCPGMVKAAGSAVALAPCEKATVLVMPYDYPTFTTPFKVRLDLE